MAYVWVLSAFYGPPEVGEARIDLVRLLEMAEIPECNAAFNLGRGGERGGKRRGPRILWKASSPLANNPGRSLGLPRKDSDFAYDCAVSTK